VDPLVGSNQQADFGSREAVLLKSNADGAFEESFRHGMPRLV
jgi:hypothetical protein